ncbi:ubiquinone/menaquinone biosynthesis C-methylase UbiE [Catenulispora sp. GP43]|uniref:class I SAM-dependent methyltransferase n=1 Tax=Catenulispora sp. GP43 TaxID=3156263 RepID=UPI0035169739
MTTTAAQEAFLQAFHAEHPAVTSEMLGRGHAPDGRSSYEMLRDRVAGRRRVLDLGCGDGLLLELLAEEDGRQLAGVDLSARSLELARRRPALSGPDVRLEVARAQQLPFADDNFDACVCHMALMLMADIEQVAAELARVLTPGGVLACVVGGGVVGGAAYDRFRAVFQEALDDLPAAQLVPALGDSRTRGREGFDEILAPTGFAPADWETVVIDLSGPVDEVWTGLTGLYTFDPLDEEAMERLREAFLAETRETAAPDGTVPFAFRIHIATARLREEI